MKVLVISGGDTSERPVSLRSAREVLKALKTNGFKAKLYDLRQGYQTLREISKHFDLFFPKLHGKEGEDGVLYQFLKSLKKPYVGSDPKGAKQAFNKITSKKYFDKDNIPTAKWRVIPAGFRSLPPPGLELPLVVKAAQGGSSKEVFLAKTSADLRSSQLKKLLSLNDQFYVEEFLSGIEITVGILDDQVLPLIEIQPPEGRWFDYQSKYSGESKEIIGAPSVPATIQQRAKDIALQIHRHFKLGPYSRTDFIIMGGIPYILEVNTPCGVGFTPQSLYPKMAAAIGLDFSKLIKKLLEITLKSHSLKN